VTAAEQAVATVVAVEWCDVLHVVEAAPADDFFLSGGDSILAVTLIGRIEQRLGIEFPLDALFLDGTLSTLVSSCQALVAEQGDDPTGSAHG
jgi:acyl carrier protein